mmetsp:Transcript_43209/g.102036  ORF Transcript_43209/g.102036 Transcript_43209/m.102036 type:complete len:828 (-) Transcript_43209:91-2574(-)
MRVGFANMMQLVLPAACCAILLCAQGATGERIYKVAAIASPPFICTDREPCRPATPLSSEFVANPDDLAPGQCLHGGVRSMNGFCVHGLLVDLITYLQLNSSAIMPFELWLTDGSVVGGYNNYVRETAQPGYLKSIGRLGACQNGQDNNGGRCDVAPAGSSSGITWDYPCGDSPCDLAMGDISINWFRKRVLQAKFTLPFMEVGLKVVVRADEPSQVSKFANFLDPFTPGLWWCWIGFIFFSAVAFAVIEDPAVRVAWFTCCMGGTQDEKNEALLNRLDTDGDENLSFFERIGYTYEIVQKYTFLAFLSPFFAVDTDHVETKLGRTYLFGWLVVNFILTASYTASLTSFLVDTNVEVALPDIKWQESTAWRRLPDSLANCYEKDSSACLAASLGGNTESILKGFLRVQPHHMTSHTLDGDLTPSQNYDRILQGDDVDDIVAWAADETAVDYALSSQDDETQCKWVQVGDTFAMGSFGMVAGPSLPNEVYERLNQQLEWAKEDKSLDGLKNVWYASAKQCFDERSETSALEPQDFGFLFIVVPAIAIFGIIWRVARQACVMSQADETLCGGFFAHEPSPARDFNDTHMAVLRLAEIVKSMNSRIPNYNPDDDRYSHLLNTQEHWIADTDEITKRMYFKNQETQQIKWSAVKKHDIDEGGIVRSASGGKSFKKKQNEKLAKEEAQNSWISDTDLLTGRTYFYNPQSKRHVWSSKELTAEEIGRLAAEGFSKEKPKSMRLSTGMTPKASTNEVNLNQFVKVTQAATEEPSPRPGFKPGTQPATRNTSTSGDIVNVHGSAPTWPGQYNQMYGAGQPGMNMGMPPGMGYGGF